jgi:hypothetical protein
MAEQPLIRLQHCSLTFLFLISCRLHRMLLMRHRRVCTCPPACSQGGLFGPLSCKHILQSTRQEGGWKQGQRSM